MVSLPVNHPAVVKLHHCIRMLDIDTPVRMPERTPPPIISTAVLSQEVGGETVLLDLQGEAYFGLNQAGTRIWQMLNDGLCFADMLDRLEEEFDAPREQLEADARDLLESLSRAGLIRAQ